MKAPKQRWHTELVALLILTVTTNTYVLPEPLAAPATPRSYVIKS
jgi:hypothetical protein